MFKMISGLLSRVLSFLGGLWSANAEWTVVTSRGFIEPQQEGNATLQSRRSNSSAFEESFKDVYRGRFEDFVDFAALDAALTSDTPIITRSLNRTSLAEAYAKIEKHNLCVTKVFMNSNDYYSDICTYVNPGSTGRREEGIVATLWGAEIILSHSVRNGTAYICANMPEKPGEWGYNPHGVTSINIVRVATKNNQWKNPLDEMPSRDASIEWMDSGDNKVRGRFIGVWMMDSGTYVYYTPLRWRYL